jgi:hypothetical protein
VNTLLELGLRALIMGVVAAALMDAWGLLLRRGFGVPTLDYALLGRWVGHVPRGRLFHPRIAAAAPVPGERALGWLVHYAIGVVFAALLLAIVGLDWARSPSIWPALAIGIGTIVAPWFLMQPGMGAGIAGARTADPRATRLRNLATHTVYGVGLYLAAVALTIAPA